MLNDKVAQAGLALVESPQGLAISAGTMTLSADFSRMVKRVRPGTINRELLVKAAKVKSVEGGGVEGGRPKAVDATAGLGDDSLLLAAAGFDVTLVERNPVIAALLRDAIERARLHHDLAALTERMHLVEGDSVDLLAHLEFTPDVVLLDPMFPDKRKDSAAKKKLQMLQKLERPCEDEQALLNAALATHPRKVVVKRPVKGPHLAGRVPSYSLAGKAIRYDVFALR